MPDIAELQTTAFDTAKPDKDLILLFGPARRFSSSVLCAITSEFPDHEIVFSDNLHKALECTREQCAKTSLAILDESFCTSLIDHQVDVRGLFPETPIALAFDGSTISHKCWDHCEPFFAGFIAFDVHLDIWLSTIRLLLAGGEYVPPRLASNMSDSVSAFSREPAINGSDRNALVAENSTTTQAPGPADLLTTRELEVLELVAEGRQNKLIACELKLSEHTVKLHLHHIISKLGVTNRTEAAACFLQDQNPLPRSA